MPKFVNHVNLNQNELRNAVIQVLNADPGTAVAGQVYYNSVVQRLRQYNGTIWQDYLTAADISGYASTTYVDNAVQTALTGLSWKDSVRAASTVNGTLATAYESGDILDGVTLATGDRILLKNQTTGAENGIYVVNASGAPTRATDADSAAELRGSAVFVEEGTANADKLFTLTTDAITLGTTALTWTQFSTGGGGGSVASYSSATHSSGATISIPYSTHNIGGGTQAIEVQVVEVSTGDKVEPDVNISSGGNITVGFASSVGANTYRVTVLG